jgi:DNA-binding response OmpR family regulator
MIAEDDEAMREMLATSVRATGCDVCEARTGRQLLDLLQEATLAGQSPALVISDQHMPEATGLDVLHWLRRCMPEVPALLITAGGDSQTHRRARDLGAVRVLDKPFELTELEDLVRRLLDIQV